MNGILTIVGLITLVLVIIYIITKIHDYYYYKTTIFKDDDKVYKAARAFAQGATFDEIRSNLNNCIEFDEEDIEEILSRSFPHITDEDGGYSAFIKAVNQVIGEDVYQVQRS